MKIPYKYLKKYIDSDISISELSDKLFQLGHEHEIVDEIFEMELTPNRGDCLSVRGLLRDLALFYNVSINDICYEKIIKEFQFEFVNDSQGACKNISFLKIEIDEIPLHYKDPLKSYFTDLGNNKTNFFTDVSNYISFETGQPTHCYDSTLINEPISLEFLEESSEFETLLDKKINLDSGELVFVDANKEIINLAGIMGGKSTACTQDTKSVIIECANFNSETIIGKSIKYGIDSEAAHKFERSVDPKCHDYVLRRFIEIVQNHTKINDIKLFVEINEKMHEKFIKLDVNKINKILGIEIEKQECLSYLQKLGFTVKNDEIKIPSFRSDIHTINDISEEVARAIGFDNIQAQPIDISLKNNKKLNYEEDKVKKLLKNEGFYEVINNPFVADYSKDSIIIDNPLDSNRRYLRTNLKDSLLENLLFNERRQKDSVKLFEITDLYSNKLSECKRVIGIIASGRIDKNYKSFSKKINRNYFEQILSKIRASSYDIQEVSRESLNSRSKNLIIYCQIQINSSFQVDANFDNLNIKDVGKNKYIPISEFPSSFRDLSFSIKDFSQCKVLEESILRYENSILKEKYVFDYYKNEKLNEIKIGFRFVFQSKVSTITDVEVDEVMKIIIDRSLSINDSISIPGYK